MAPSSLSSVASLLGACGERVPLSPAQASLTTSTPNPDRTGAASDPAPADLELTSLHPGELYIVSRAADGLGGDRNVPCTVARNP